VPRRADPPHGVPGLDARDARRVAAARPALQGGGPSAYEGVAAGGAPRPARRCFRRVSLQTAALQGGPGRLCGLGQSPAHPWRQGRLPARWAARPPPQPYAPGHLGERPAKGPPAPTWSVRPGPPPPLAQRHLRRLPPRPAAGCSTARLPGPAQAPLTHGACHQRGKRWRMVPDRSWRWQEGGRKGVRERGCARPNCRVRLTPWQPLV
jgi:hypothetical protein